MNVTSNPMQLVKQFSDLQANLNRKDSQLSQWQHNTYPHPDVADAFSSTAADLDTASLGMMDLHPDRTDLQERLKQATLKVARDGGQIGNMARNRITFGSGWSGSLDRSIETTRMATDAAIETPSGTVSQKPNPLKVMKSLSELQSSLSRWDATLTEWQNDRNTYPAQGVDENFDRLASQLYDARNQMRALHPEQAELINSLGRNSRWVSSTAGNIDTMAGQRQTFGSGWNQTLDGSIESVRQAISVLAG